MDRDTHLKRLRFRAWHRGTKEADLLIGGFFDRYGTGWDEPALAWFAAILEEDDVDVMAWAIGTQPTPERYAGPLMQAMQRLDFIPIER